ncbi:MAG TPA: PAS domain S-box protein [Anaerolineaceae bacterium]|nr:PAS domain S-box protein [Anaerolineaceae bacterium]HPN54192.1 PAS domain S-box protein [Anaerolineaceae bacterium]
MNDPSFMELIYNAALLLALVLIYDILGVRLRRGKFHLRQIPTGLLIGAIGLAVMLTPWVLIPGVVFDTRSVLLSISGLFFGSLPTVIAMLITAAMRLYQGGSGAVTGTLVIVAAGAMGIAWRHWRKTPLEKIGWIELYLFGLAVHVVMLLLMLTLPKEIAGNVLANITLPVLILYPLVSALLGKLLSSRLLREQIQDQLIRTTNRMNETQQLTRVGGWEWDVTNNLMYWTDETYIIHGITPGSLHLDSYGMVAKSLSCYDPEDRPVIEAAFQNCVKTGQAYDFEFPFTTLDGKRIWIRTQARGSIEDGRVTRVIGNIMDITAQKGIEFALKESEEKFRRIVNMAQEGIWTMNAERRTTFVNPYMASMLGYQPEEMLGHLVEDFMCPEDLPAHYERMAARQKGEHGQYEHPFKHKDGRKIRAMVSATALMDEKGCFAGSVAMLSDITVRKRMDAVLQGRLRLLQKAATQSQKEALRETLDVVGELVSSPIGFYHFLEADQKTLSLQAWSTQTVETFCKAEGYDSHYPINQAGVWVDCVQERRPVIHNDYLALTHRKGLPEGHAEVRRELVVPVFREDQIVAILGVGNKPEPYDENDVAVVSIFADLAWDIAGRKKMEETLRESSEMSTAILNAATESVILMNVDGTVQALNPIAAVRMQKRVEELIGVNIYEVLPPPVAESRKKWVEKVIREKHPVHFEDQRANFWFENNITPIIDPDGQIRRVAIFGRDVTERKLSEQNIQAAQAELRRLLDEAEQSRRALLSVVEDQKEAEEKIRSLNRELENRVRERTAQLTAAIQELEAFSYSVSHDLRAPLRAMNGFSSALMEDYGDKLDEEGQRYLTRIQEGSRRMAMLINDLLNLSRVSRTEINLQPVDLSAQIHAITAELAAQAPERQVRFEIAPNLTANCDANLIHIALENLINNAFKFTSGSDEAVISVGCQDESGEKIYFVKDNGAGFNMEYANKLFIPFQRLHNPSEFSGTGIGLSIVQRIITRHGGRIWAESAPGAGATFYFTLGS